MLTAVDNILVSGHAARTSKEFSDYARCEGPTQAAAVAELLEIAWPCASGERGIHFSSGSTRRHWRHSGDTACLRRHRQLIENAFRPPGGRPPSSRGVDSQVVVSVDDDGPGVAGSEDLTLLLHQSSGTGLGLAITRKRSRSTAAPFTRRISTPDSGFLELPCLRKTE